MHLGVLTLSITFAAVAACSSDGPNPSPLDRPRDSEDGGEPEEDAGPGRSRVDDAARRDSAAPVRGGDRDSSNICSSHVVQATAIVPDMLVVLDASLSMAALRWVPSVSAVSQLVEQYESNISFGLELFPSGGLPTCSVGTPEVPLALNNARAISQVMNGTLPTGLTPTGPALQAAARSLGDRNAVGADAKSTPTYVLLVTDGEPDCIGDDLADPVASANNGLTMLAQQGIKTYVIGYQIDPVGQALMDQWAVTGGTEKMYPVEDAVSLQSAFDAITKDLVSCSFELTEAPDDPSYVSVLIDGMQADLNASDGWVLDGTRVTLQGRSCATVKDGRTHELNTTIECTPVQVQ